MDKAFIKRILTVIMGICALVLLFSFVSLICDAVGFDDLIENTSADSVNAFSKWTSVAMVCVLVPLFASYLFSCLSKSVIFRISSAALSLFTAICAIAFASVFRKIVLDDWSSSDYAIFTAYLQQMLQIIVPTIIGCAFYTVSSIKALRKKPIEAAKEEE